MLSLTAIASVPFDARKTTYPNRSKNSACEAANHILILYYENSFTADGHCSLGGGSCRCSYTFRARK